MQLMTATALIFATLTSILALALPSEVTGPDVFKKQPVKVALENKKGLVVVFLSAKCPCSDSHIIEMKSLKTDFPDFNFVAVHSNVNEGEEVTTQYFKKVELPFPVVQDEKAEIANQFQALKTPHAFVVLPDGKVAYQGGVSSSKRFENADRKLLREALDDLQAGKTVRTPEGRTLGCVIERGEKNVW